MAALTLPTFGDVRIAAGGASEDKRHVGDFGRAFSGRARSDVRGEFRVWRFRTDEYPVADARTIRDELMGTPPLSCSGDVLGGTVLVHPQNVSLDYGPDAGALIAIVTFELQEQA